MPSNHRQQPGGGSPPPLSYQSLGWRVFEVASIALAVLALASILWLAVDVLLLLFAATLLATLLRAPTGPLMRVGMPKQLALTLVVVVAVAIVVALGWVLVPEINAQVPQLVDSLGKAVQQLERSIGLDQWAESVAEEINLRNMLPSPAGLIGGATGIISSTFGLVANLVILFVVGVYLAADPSLYVDGVTRLVPQQKRVRVRETLHELGRTLRWWLIGQLVSMTAVGILSYVGLTLLGVPLALLLAVIAFFLTFIPFLGPILAGIPVLLVAFSEGPEVALYALVVFWAIQSFEGYVLTPLVQRRTVSLPPALTIAAQVVLGVLVGAFGVMLATPLAAAGMVATRMLYVEDVLGERTDRPGDGPSPAEGGRGAEPPVAADG